MPNLILEHPPAPAALVTPARATAAGLLLWLAAVITLAAAGSFAAPHGAPPLALVAGVSTPLVIFFITFRAWPAFREWVLGVDLQQVVAFQAWRFIGFGFIALHVHGVLPGIFAWPAGLGDMAIAAGAPWMVSALARDPGFAAAKRFRLWHGLGLLDLGIAITVGVLGSGLVPGIVGEVTTAPMAMLPLVLVPVYLVPIMVMLHATALLQARRIRAG